MKIAILTSGILPIPAVQGGAVENLLDFVLEYNNKHHLHDMTVFSVWDDKIKGHPALQSDINHYEYVKVTSWRAKIAKNLCYLLFGEKYYHYTIEYFFRKAWKRLQKNHYDIILLDNRPGYALDMRVPDGTKLFLYLHNDLLNNTTKGYKEIYNKATRILTVSNYISSCVKTINPDDTKCFPILNGIDIRAFSPNIPSYITRSQLGLDEDDFVMVFSGRVTKEKGVSELIDAIIQLKQYKKIKLLIIGSSFYGDATREDSFIKNLKQKAEIIKNRILFTGYIPYSQMPQYLKISDIAVIPSLWDDPFPTTVLEAQAMGLPIITTRLGGIPEEVTEDNAILLDTDDQFVDQLAKAILDLYEHPEKRRDMSEASLKRSKLFSKERYAREFFETLEITT